MSVLDDFDPAPGGRRIKKPTQKRAARRRRAAERGYTAESGPSAAAVSQGKRFGPAPGQSYQDWRSKHDAAEGAAELRQVHAPGFTGPVHVKAHTRQGRVVKGYARRKKR